MIKIKKLQNTPINHPTIYSAPGGSQISAGLPFFHRTARIFATIRNLSVIARDSWIEFVFSGRVGQFYVGSFKIYFMKKNSCGL
jgi:hypothetical protein